MYLLPFTWLVSEERWIPYESSLLYRPSAYQTTEEWNTTCIPCHSTAGRTRPVEFSDDLDTQVAELGIACEACHGPAETHVSHFQNPLARYFEYGSKSSETEIVNPTHLNSRASAQVCGQCHSHTQAKGKAEALRAQSEGRAYRPGDELEETREIHIRPSADKLKSPIKSYVADSITWPDGMVRTAGRDYHGVLETPCFAGGEYDCLTCHSMHGYADRDDQLKPGMRTNQACTQCHDDFTSPEALEQHTHHEPESTGSRCYDCHMPHSNYALLKSVRSHSLTSPTVAESIDAGRPNACNLCHADQTLAWTADALERWYGQRSSPPDGYRYSSRAAVVDWLLEGDAAQRGLMAATLARADVQHVSGTGWMAPLLAQLLDDAEYPALPLIAAEAIRGLPGYADLDLDTAGARQRVIAHWRSDSRDPSDSVGGQPVYGTPSGDIDLDAIEAAYSRRSDRRVGIAE